MLRMGVIVCKTWKLEISEKPFEIKLHLIFNESVAKSCSGCRDNPIGRSAAPIGLKRSEKANAID